MRPVISPNSNKGIDFPVKIVFTAAISIVSIFLYCGLFAVPSADDYAYVNLAREHGLFLAQKYSYAGWSGRYTATFLITFLGDFCLENYWIVPWSTILLFPAAGYYLFSTAFYELRKKISLMIFSLSYFALYLSNSVAGHGVGVVNEGFFWMSGAFTYQYGAVFYSLFVSSSIWYIRGKYQPANMVVLLLSCILAIGSNETLMMLTVITAAAIMYLYWRSSGLLYKIPVTAAVVTFSFFVILAPGNSVRLATSTEHSVLSALGICVEKVVQVYFYSLFNPFLWLFVFVFAYYIDELFNVIRANMKQRNFLIFSVLLVYILYFPVAWSLDSGAPDRLVAFIGFPGMFFSLCMIRLVMIRMQDFFSIRKIAAGAVICSLLLSPFFLEPLFIALETVFTGKKFHALHNERNDYVQKSGEQGIDAVEVEPIKKNRLLLFSDLDISNHSVHYAKYYGVQAVSLAEK